MNLKEVIENTVLDLGMWRLQWIIANSIHLKTYGKLDPILCLKICKADRLICIFKNNFSEIFFDK